MATLRESGDAYDRHALRGGAGQCDVADVIIKLETERDAIAEAATQGITALTEALEGAGTRMQRAEAERDRLRAALAWYADRDNYNGYSAPGHDDGYRDWINDGGDRARAALEALA